MKIDPKRLIIRRPGAQTAERKIISWLLSLGFWWRLASLIRGFLAAVGWGTAWGISSAIAGHIRAHAALHAAMLIYMPEVAGLVFLLWGWALYNWLRFHGEGNRRGESLPSLSPEEVSEAFSLPPSLVRQAREAKIGIFHFDDKGNIQRIDCCSSASEAEETLHRLALPPQ